jgi:hypothetical protein
MPRDLTVTDVHIPLDSLSTMGYGQGITNWALQTNARRVDLEGPEFWRDASNVIADGDFVFIKHLGPAPGSSIYAMWHTPRGLVGVPIASTFNAISVL